MSANLAAVIEHAGYDLSTREDALWLVCQKNEFEKLLEQAQDLLDNSCELCGSTDDGHYNNNAECMV